MNFYRNSVLRNMKSSLFAAARMNDVDVLREYVASSSTYPLTCRGADGVTTHQWFHPSTVDNKSVRTGTESIIHRKAIGPLSAILSLHDASSGFVTMLHIAAEAGNTAFVSELLSLGARVCAVDVDGQTAVHRVLPYGDHRLKIIEMVVASNIDVLEVRDVNGRSITSTIEALINENPQYQLASAVLRTSIFQIYNEQVNERRRSVDRKPERQQSNDQTQSQLRSSQQTDTRDKHVMDDELQYPQDVSVNSSPDKSTSLNAQAQLVADGADVSHLQPHLLQTVCASTHDDPGSHTLWSLEDGTFRREIDVLSENAASTASGAEPRDSVKNLRRGSILASATRSVAPNKGVMNLNGDTSAAWLSASAAQNLSVDAARIGTVSTTVPATGIAEMAGPKHVSAAFARHVSTIDSALTDLMQELHELSSDSNEGDDMYEAAGGFGQRYDDVEQSELVRLLAAQRRQQNTPVTSRMIQRQQHQHRQEMPLRNIFGKVPFCNVPLTAIPLNAAAYACPERAHRQTTSASPRTSPKKPKGALVASHLQQPLRIPSRRSRKTELQERAAIFEAFKAEQGSHERLGLTGSDDESSEGSYFSNTIDFVENAGDIRDETEDEAHPLQALLHAAATKPNSRRSHRPHPLAAKTGASYEGILVGTSGGRHGNEIIEDAVSSPLLTLSGRLSPVSPLLVPPFMPSISVTALKRASMSGNGPPKPPPPPAFKNDFGEWVVATDCFGRSYSSKGDDCEVPVVLPSTLNESALVNDAFQVVLNKSVSSQNTEVQVIIDSTLDVERPSNQERDRSPGPSFAADERKVRRSSVLQRRVHQLFDASAKSVPSLFEHFKEYVDPLGNFKFDEVTLELHRQDQHASLPAGEWKHGTDDPVGPALLTEPSPAQAVTLQEIFDDDSSDDGVEEELRPRRSLLDYSAFELNQLLDTDSSMAPLMPSFEPDADKRREQRRAQVLRQRQHAGASLAKLNKAKPLSTAALRANNAETMMHDVEYGRMIASHRAQQLNPFAQYLAIPSKTPSSKPSIQQVENPSKQLGNPRGLSSRIPTRTTAVVSAFSDPATISKATKLSSPATSKLAAPKQLPPKKNMKFY
jgi:hypothetical protein